jgi:hypothetical protein
MAFSSGAQRDLYYAIETDFGDGDNLDEMKEVRNIEDSISLARDSFVSEERRGDRGIHDMRLGNKQPAGDISFEFSYEAFDDFLMAALGAAAWVNAYGTVAPDVTVVASTRVISRTDGSWITDGIKVGDPVTIAMTSFTADAVGVIASVTATDMTLETGVTGLEDVTVAETATVTTTATVIKKGSKVHSFVVEKAFTDISEYQLYTGGIVNTMSLDLSSKMITGSFGMLFKDADNDSSAFHTETPSNVSTSKPYDGFTGYINEGGVVLAEASSFSFSLDNGYNRNFVLMQTTCSQMTSGKSNVTGSVTLYFKDSLVYAKFVEETESSVEFQLKDDEGNAYVVTLPRIKYTTADTPVASDDAIVNTMSFQALDDATEKTNIIIRKQPKVA